MDSGTAHKKIRACLRRDEKRDVYSKLLRFCQKNGYLFADKEFPPEQTSLVSPEYQKEYNGEFDGVAWKRAADFFKGKPYDMFSGTIDPSDILQGGLGDCYFLCALASLAENPSLIRRLFDTETINPHGVVSVWLNISGTWRNVVVDEYLPVTQERPGYVQQLAFSSTSSNELWVILLEKAYAKAYGCYYSIIGGDPVHALRDLTGAPYQHVRDFADPDKAWATLAAFNDKSYCFVAWMKSSAVSEEKTATGLVCGHAYSVLDLTTVKTASGKQQRLVQLRNPWGTFEWNGDYSDNSPLWTDALRKQLKVEVKDDGVFWMPFERFIENYEGVGVLKIEKDYIFHSARLKRTGPQDTVKLLKLHVEAATHAYLSLDQIDAKIIDDPAYRYSYFRMTLGRLVPEEGVTWVASLCSPDRNAFLELTLEKGEYVLLIDCYWLCPLADSICVTSYSKQPIDLVKAEESVAALWTIEYLLWRSYVLRNKAAMEKSSANTVTLNKEAVKVQNYKVKLPDAMVTVYASWNESKTQMAVQTTRIVAVDGYDIFARRFAGSEVTLSLDKDSPDFFLTKMNPKFENFSIKQQVKSIAATSAREVPDLSVVRRLFDLSPTP